MNIVFILAICFKLIEHHFKNIENQYVYSES